ncbi:MAG: DEAD/DEAH box helicase [Minisyncoccia bacterium]
MDHLIITSKNLGQIYKNNREDLIYIISKLKKRMAPDDPGIDLVDEVKFFEIPKKVVYYNVKIDKIKEISDEFYEFILNKIRYDQENISNFQYNSFKSILSILNNPNRSQDYETLIIQAPTGSGKTDAFLLPLLFDSAKTGKKFILVYPRNALATDQLKKIIKYVAMLNENLSNDYKKLSIGILYGGIGAIDQHTYEYLDKTSLFEKQNYSSQKIIKFKSISCPICENGNLYSFYFYSKKNSSFGPFYCSNTSCSSNLNKNKEGINIYVSKQRIVEEKPEIIITTVESLNSIIFKPKFQEYLQNTSFIVFDEAHTYYSVYGSHVANLIRMLKNEFNLKIILSSATIPNSITFASKLTGSNTSKILEIKPNNEDYNNFRSENNAIPKEFYTLIKASNSKNNYSNAPSTLIEFLLLLGHSVNLNFSEGKDRTLIFFDSKDALLRSYNNFNDADSKKKLYEFRINKNKDIVLQEFKCPYGSEKNCNGNMKECKVYQNGECWYGLTRSIWSGNVVPRQNSLKIDKSLSENPIYNINDSDLVFSTSTLELGINDTAISTIVQYRPTYSIFSFIQRKGRAGRKRNSNSYIYMILTDDPSDRFYYNNLEAMLDLDYILPLNEENPYSKWIRNILDRIRNELYNNQNSDNYLDETKVLYLRLFDKACAEYKEFIGNAIRANISSITPIKRNDYKNNINNKKQDINDKKNNLLNKYNTQNPFDYLKNKFSDIIKNSSNNNQLLNKVQEWQKNLEKLEVLINDLINGSNSEKEDNLIKLITNLREDISKFTNDSENIKNYSNQKWFKILDDEIYPYLKKLINGKEIYRDYLELEKYDYQIKSLDELWHMFDYWDPLSIVIYFYRAWFYFELSNPNHKKACENNNEFHPKFIIPTSFFTNGQNILLDLDGDKRSISITDLINRYTPHSMVATIDLTSDEQQTRYIVMKYNYVEDNDGNIKVSLKMRGTENLSNKKGIKYLDPTLIECNLVDMGSDNTFKVCKNCLKVYEQHIKRCYLCNQPLIDGSIRSEPNYDFELDNFNENEEFLGLIKGKGNLSLFIYGESVSILYKFTNNNKTEFRRINKKITYETPMGRIIKEKSIIKVNVEKLNQDEYENFKKLLGFKIKKESNLNEIYVHSIAHLLLKTIAFLSGVNVEELDYMLDLENNNVYIFEKNEFDNGIIEAFYQTLKNNPFLFVEKLMEFTQCRVAEVDKLLSQDNNMFSKDNKVLNQLLDLRIDNLKANKIDINYAKRISQEFYDAIKNNDGEKIKELLQKQNFEKIIQCIDGCSDCLFINTCHEENNQKEKISRILAEQYVNKKISKIPRNNISREILENLIKMNNIIIEVNDEYVKLFGL